MTIKRVNRRAGKPNMAAIIGRNIDATMRKLEDDLGAEAEHRHFATAPTGTGRMVRAKIRRGYVWVYNGDLKAYTFCKHCGVVDGGIMVLDLSGHARPVYRRSPRSNIHYIKYTEPKRDVDFGLVGRAWTRHKIVSMRAKVGRG